MGFWDSLKSGAEAFAKSANEVMERRLRQLSDDELTDLQAKAYLNDKDGLLKKIEEEWKRRGK